MVFVQAVHLDKLFAAILIGLFGGDIVSIPRQSARIVLQTLNTLLVVCPGTYIRLTDIALMVPDIVEMVVLFRTIITHIAFCITNELYTIV